MAEAFLMRFGGHKFSAESAGLEACKLNPLAVEVMKKDGINISSNQTMWKSSEHVFRQLPYIWKSLEHIFLSLLYM